MIINIFSFILLSRLGNLGNAKTVSDYPSVFSNFKLKLTVYEHEQKLDHILSNECEWKCNPLFIF